MNAPGLQWSTQANPTARIGAEEFSRKLGYVNVVAFEHERRKGLVPAPDGVFEKLLFWHPEAVEATIAAHAEGIRRAFGYSSPSEAVYGGAI